MFLTYYIMTKCRNVTKDVSDVTSIKWKYRTMVFNVTSIFLACYFFYRHNTFCEPLGIYLTLIFSFKQVTFDSLSQYFILDIEEM